MASTTDALLTALQDPNRGMDVVKPLINDLYVLDQAGFVLLKKKCETELNITISPEWDFASSDSEKTFGDDDSNAATLLDSDAESFDEKKGMEEMVVMKPSLFQRLMTSRRERVKAKARDSLDAEIKALKTQFARSKSSLHSCNHLVTRRGVFAGVSQTLISCKQGTRISRGSRSGTSTLSTCTPTSLSSTPSLSISSAPQMESAASTSCSRCFTTSRPTSPASSRSERRSRRTRRALPSPLLPLATRRRNTRPAWRSSRRESRRPSAPRPPPWAIKPVKTRRVGRSWCSPRG